MATPYQIDNEGLGSGPFLTMTMDKDNFFTQEDLNKNNTACFVSNNNEVSKSPECARLFGKVVWVSANLVSGTQRPDHCAVAFRGVLRFNYNQDTPLSVNESVVTINGQAAWSPIERDNIVIAVSGNGKTCDVVLG